MHRDQKVLLSCSAETYTYLDDLENVTFLLFKLDALFFLKYFLHFFCFSLAFGMQERIMCVNAP